LREREKPVIKEGERCHEGERKRDKKN